MGEIYLDHAATTYVRPEVKKIMEKYYSEEFGNPGSFHTIGLRAKRALDAARKNVMELLDAKHPDEVIFTGSGTESINLAIKGIARANKLRGKHIITTKIEHEAVLESCEYLEKYEGFKITYLGVDKYGIVSVDDLKNAIKKDTILVSVMYANNEVGTIQDIKDLAKVTHETNSSTLFHTDACQAGGTLEIKGLGVDLMTLNSSKVYGPKGVGLLYIKKGIQIHPIIHGGGQEFKLRSGTENIPGVIGFAEALSLAQNEKEVENKRVSELRDKLVEGIKKNIPKVLVNGHPTKRLPNNANISIMDVEGEAMMLYMNQYGICASSGSACTSKSLDPSHVILAMGFPYEVAHGTLRFTLGKRTTENDIKKVIEVLPGIVKTLRDLSPVDLEMDEVTKNVK